MKKINYKELFKKHQTLICLVVISGLLAAIAELIGGTTQNEQREISAPDTVIPPGYVLVPIEVQNHEAMDSILGSYGVVDLFAQDADGTGRSKKVAERVKILRAPLNPNHFAVLAPEEEAPRLVKES